MAQDEALKSAKTYAHRVRQLFDTKAIYLYGSYAKGTPRNDSDIDIAIVVDGIQSDYLSTVTRLWKLTREVDDAIEPVLLFDQPDDSGFLQTVRMTGVAL